EQRPAGLAKCFPQFRHLFPTVRLEFGVAAQCCNKAGGPWSGCMSPPQLAVRDQRSTCREFLRHRPGGAALPANERAPTLAADAVIATVKKAGAAGAHIASGPCPDPWA